MQREHLRVSRCKSKLVWVESPPSNLRTYHKSRRSCLRSSRCSRCGRTSRSPGGSWRRNTVSRDTRWHVGSLQAASQAQTWQYPTFCPSADDFCRPERNRHDRSTGRWTTEHTSKPYWVPQYLYPGSSPSQMPKQICNNTSRERGRKGAMLPGDRLTWWGHRHRAFP